MNPSSGHRITLSVFMPFYNEEKNVQRVVEDVRSALVNIPSVEKYEVIVVNDGSRDATESIAKDLVERYPEVRLVSHERNLGYGAAVMTGIKSSIHDYVFLMDGDGQFDINEITKLLEHVPEHSMVIGYRKDRQDHLIRKINAKLWNLLNRVVFGLHVHDIDCAFKLFKREMLIDLPLSSNGAVISTEILVRLRPKVKKIIQVPVSHYPRKEGKPTGANLGVIVKAFKEFAILHRHIRKNSLK
jgi:glycosyltransferase involved in cell wall biosynthesis